MSKIYLIHLLCLFHISCIHLDRKTPSQNTRMTQPQKTLLPIVMDQSQQRSPQGDLNLQSLILHKSMDNRENTFFDGPAIDSFGNYYVANLNNPGTIFRRTSNDSNFTLWLTLPGKSYISSIRVGANNTMFITDFFNHCIYSVNLSETNAEPQLYFQGKDFFAQPNDLAVAKDSTLFISDPVWSKSKNNFTGAIYKLTANRELIQIASNLNAANGIDLNEDETKLYYSESKSGNLMMIDLTTFSKISGDKPKNLNAQLFYKFEPDTVDGIQTDTNGNIYVTRITKGKIDIISSEGKLIGTIALSEMDPTNITIGGTEGNQLLVSIRQNSTLELFQLSGVIGRQWKIIMNSTQP